MNHSCEVGRVLGFRIVENKKIDLRFKPLPLKFLKSRSKVLARPTNEVRHEYTDKL